MQFDEGKLKNSAQEHLERCRPGDWNHALRVVSWAKRLGDGRDELPLIVTAAYIHDIGWRDVLPFDKKITFDELLKYEKQANDNSEPFINEFLQELGCSEVEIETVNKLVRAADSRKAT